MQLTVTMVMISCDVWTLLHRRSWNSMQWPSVLQCWLVYMEANRRYLTFTHEGDVTRVYVQYPSLIHTKIIMNIMFSDR